MPRGRKKKEVQEDVFAEQPKETLEVPVSGEAKLVETKEKEIAEKRIENIVEYYKVEPEQTYTESQVKEAIKMLYNFNDDVLIEKLWLRLKERLDGIALK